MLNIEDRAGQAISAIRSVRPRGPYVIGGHCYGGVLAFETTRQLLEQGEQVTPLVLLDVPAPGYPKIVRSWKRYLAESRRLMINWVKREPALKVSEFRSHLERLKRLGVRKLRGQAGRTWSSLASSDRVATLGQYEVNSLAMAEYVLKDFAAPILHFVAADEAVSTRVLDDPRYGWRDFARGGMDFRSVRGGHNSMLGAEHAPKLAAELRRVLNHLERESTQ
jgi:thioesterase domain-containing protein